ncbi:MAG TPA: hypothetical protein VMP01_25315, partial [Pirellulaceae bacterium]|nr:hypothetical protein [Pirellulaceae bacterium]
MTNQVADTVKFKGQDHELAGLSGGTLFHPRVVGIEISGYSTATYRGFVCSYVIDGDQLKLNRLVAHATSEPPSFCGVEAISLVPVRKCLSDCFLAGGFGSHCAEERLFWHGATCWPTNFRRLRRDRRG